MEYAVTIEVPGKPHQTLGITIDVDKPPSGGFTITLDKSGVTDFSAFGGFARFED